MTNLRALPPRRQPRWERDDVLQRLSEQDVQAVYRALGVERFKPGGSADWKAFVPWRNNVNSEAMTIHKADGVWSDKALDEGGSIFDAVVRGGQATDLNGAINWVADHLGMVPDVEAGGLVPAGTTTYLYTDASGAVLYRVVRTDYATSDGEVVKKDFKQHRLVGGVWDEKRGPSEPEKTLYNMPLIADPENLRKPVFLVEGEKCADTAVRSLGILATCVAGGSNGWLEKYAYLLAGRDVVVLPDGDDPGWKFAAGAALSLAPRVRSLKVVGLPGLGPRTKSGGKDIVDWLGQGHGYDDLLEVVAAAPPYEPPAPKSLMVSLWDLYRNPPPRPAQLIEKVWEPESFGMIAAHPKSYKGFFVTDFLASLASGADFLGNPEFMVAEPVKVVYWFEEGASWDVLRRLARWCAARRVAPGDWMERVRLVYGQGLRIADDDGINLLRAEIEAFAPQVVICDTLARAAAGLDENTSQDMGRVIDTLDGIKRDYHTAAIYVHHLNKGGGYRGHSSLYAACDCLANLERPEGTNRLLIDFELKSGHQADRIELELRDDSAGDGALFVCGDQDMAPKGVKGQPPTPEQACRYLHRYGIDGWMSGVQLRARLGLSPSVFTAFAQDMCVTNLWAANDHRPATGRPSPGYIVLPKGLDLIGVLSDD